MSTNWGAEMMRTGMSAIVLALSLTMLADQSTAQQSGESNEEIEEIVVIGSSRLPDALTTFPGSVTRVSAEDIEAISAITNDISQVLAQAVPGIGVSARGSASNFEQSLRGRKPAILVDGVPIGTPLRDGRHDVRSLSPVVIQSIEVIRGSSALYGNGGAGGVVNYITKRGANEPVTWRTEVGTEISLTSLEDSFAPFVHQSGQGSVGSFSFVGDVYLERTDSFFDAEGNRIRPSPNGQGGLAESDVYSGFLRLGYDIGAHRIDASVLHYDQEQDSKFNVLVPGDPENEIPVSVREGPRLPGEEGTSNTNTLVSLVYAHSDVFGSALRAQGYYQDYENVFDFNPTFFPGGGQSRITSEKSGLRLDISTPLNIGAAVTDGRLLWGLDVQNDETGQDLVDGRVWAPQVDQGAVAGFAQATLPINDLLTINAGFRYEEIDVEFPGFTALFSGVEVSPGEADYTADTFNVGFAYQFTDVAAVFASFSQGFSVAEVGRVLRQADETTDFANSEIEASVVDNYELGLRFDTESLSASIAGFFATSNLGTSITNDLQIARQKEETFGVEVAVESTPAVDWALGGTFTWTGGRRDSDGDGDVDRDLASNRVNPAKLTAYVEHQLSDSWALRIQALHSAGRNVFEERLSFGESPVEPYTLLDGSLRIDIGDYGKLTVAISNLTNEDYFTVASYLFNDPLRFSKGQGMGGRITYSISY